MPTSNGKPSPRRYNGASFGHDIIVIGASTGGVEALMTVVADLPEDLPAAVFVVLHLSPQSPSHLPEILGRYCALPTFHPHDNEPIERSRIYVAQPDFHMLIEDSHVRMARGPRENRHRPAIDPLFRTAAVAYGSRVIGVILTGALDDGTAGLYAIKERGGMAVVQNPEDALIRGMPESALEYVAVDYVLPLADIGKRLARLCHEPAPDQQAHPVSAQLGFEANIAKLDEATMQSEDRPGKLSALTCPECKGPLWELRDGELVHYRCRSGHSFTGESMLAGQSEALDEALWAAYNTLNESALMAERLATDARRRSQDAIAVRFEERARVQRSRAHVIRGVLDDSDHTVPVSESGARTPTRSDESVQTDVEQ